LPIDKSTADSFDEVGNTLRRPPSNQENRRVNVEVDRYTQYLCLQNVQSSFLFNFEKCQYVLCTHEEHSTNIGCYKFNLFHCIKNNTRYSNTKACNTFKSSYCLENNLNQACFFYNRNKNTNKCQIKVDESCLIEN
jgi:hypothetical protein